MFHRVETGAAVYLEFGGWDMVARPELNLIEAVKKGCPPIVQAFLAKGCDPNATDRNGGTALIWAAAKGDSDAVRLLIAAGAVINAEDSKSMTALKMAQNKGREDIAAPADLTWRRVSQQTVLASGDGRRKIGPRAKILANE